MNFDKHKDYILEDERVLLRPLNEHDIELLSPFAVKEPEIWKFSLVVIDGEKALHDYFMTALTGRVSGEQYAFSIYDKRLKAFAGCTRFYDIQTVHNTLQLGYTWYGKEFQGTGLNKHCKFLLLRFAFENLGVDRVEFRADVNNTKSIAAMKSIGCTIEGILRSHLPKPDGSRRDSIILSILKYEWFASIKNNLQAKLIGV